MVNVFITVDTEVWPFTPDWRETCLDADMRRDIYGETASGDFGVPYQLEILHQYGLKAVFLVEALFACEVGLEPLRKIVETIQNQGQEVQLHLHSEWLDWMNPSLLPGQSGKNMKDFTCEEQQSLIAKGIQNLRDCGVNNICAFRAGNYGANFDTLRALAANGIRYDTSLNTCYLDSTCDMPTDEPVLQPKMMAGVMEFPITFFRDWPGHQRHTQICAVSSREMEAALWNAWKENWYSFVIVSHSFELIRRGVETNKPPQPDGVVVRRFQRLCQFLADHRDKFSTRFFGEIQESEIPDHTLTRGLSSPEYNTVIRMAEQMMRKIF